MAVAIQFAGAYVRAGPAGADPSLTQNAGEAILFPDQPTAAAYLAARNPLPGGGTPMYQTVTGYEDFSTESLS